MEFTLPNNWPRGPIIPWNLFSHKTLCYSLVCVCGGGGGGGSSITLTLVVRVLLPLGWAAEYESYSEFKTEDDSEVFLGGCKTYLHCDNNRSGTCVFSLTTLCYSGGAFRVHGGRRLRSRPSWVSSVLECRLQESADSTIYMLPTQLYYVRPNLVWEGVYVSVR